MSKRSIAATVLCVCLLTTVDLLAGEPESELRKTPLSELGATIAAKSMLLADISIKLLLLGSPVTPMLSEDLREEVEIVYKVACEAEPILRSVGLLLMTTPHLDERYQPFFAKVFIEELGRASRLIESSIQALDYQYTNRKLVTLLLTIGDPRKILNESLQAIADGKKHLAGLIPNTQQ